MSSLAKSDKGLLESGLSGCGQGVVETFWVGGKVLTIVMGVGDAIHEDAKLRRGVYLGVEGYCPLWTPQM